MSLKSLKERIQKEITFSTDLSEISAFKYVLEMIDKEPKETAYVVTDGAYSDFHAVGVYLDETEAREFQQYYAANETIEEYDLNEAVPDHPAGRFGWAVLMHRDGTVNNCYRIIGQPQNEYAFGHSGICRFQMWATDREHAMKIANERRAMLIANDEWEENYNPNRG